MMPEIEQVEPWVERVEPWDVQRERARRAVTKALRAHGMDHPTLTDWAVQQSLDALDVTTLGRWLRQVPTRGGVPGVSILEAADMLRRDALELEPLLDAAARRGELVRIEHGPLVRYSVLWTVNR